ncbi:MULTISPECIES: DUF2231 domain-containing protein [Pseudoxanthomonas]|jgi:Predicted membrane protein|uniref:DUF2231 domain-containing protein n=2 Tax=Pseudoxanthomonas TaxID=83618 RepID=E6WVZ9_PSEUU|nr:MULTISPECIES: DUF2231 domain-containing protein [Pseudoxanthomonas]ADV28490.1 hypothetical protein Psesu_2662 [Pseudoxanthomonas suwonensis 11-1]TWH10907.1 putative membrane protein [Pseudoxanthomonas taiwanensis J19]
MVATVEGRYAPAFHPVHALLLGGALSLILGTLLADIAYARTYEIQWINFAAWLNVGGLVFAAAALVCALLGLVPSRRTRGSALHCLLWAVAWILALLNALVHARDAWAAMPMALVLSVLVFAVALVSIFFAAWPLRAGGVR